MSDVKVRISKDLYEKIKDLAEKRPDHPSIRNVVEEALTIYLTGSQEFEKPIKGIQSKIIHVQYPHKCRICGKPIKKGDLAYWVKYTFTDNTTRSVLICLDCYYTRYDTALAKKYLKIKELEAIKKGLEKINNHLANEINEKKQIIEKIRFIASLSEIKQKIYEQWRDFNAHFHELIEKDEQLQKINEYMEKLMDTIDKITELEYVAHKIVQELGLDIKIETIETTRKRKEYEKKVNEFYLKRRSRHE